MVKDLSVQMEITLPILGFGQASGRSNIPSYQNDGQGYVNGRNDAPTPQAPIRGYADESNNTPRASDQRNEYSGPNSNSARGPSQVQASVGGNILGLIKGQGSVGVGGILPVVQVNGQGSVGAGGNIPLIQGQGSLGVGGNNPGAQVNGQGSVGAGGNIHGQGSVGLGGMNSEAQVNGQGAIGAGGSVYSEGSPAPCPSNEVGASAQGFTVVGSNGPQDRVEGNLGAVASPTGGGDQLQKQNYPQAASNKTRKQRKYQPAANLTSTSANNPYTSLIALEKNESKPMFENPAGNVGASEQALDKNFELDKEGALKNHTGFNKKDEGYTRVAGRVLASASNAATSYITKAQNHVAQLAIMGSAFLGVIVLAVARRRREASRVDRYAEDAYFELLS
ncbi:unnamed protein product [Albugo candida]|uniref:Uncharacterized protein n=1 Tax=Albugo candida TaxID=65357 RepID=A0A024GJD4_9STRA|nr:unnamed protein product [Albugo candida]|eukprot:CCI46642.1 unnamed protein product [Albugo candida]